jgi:hypothetical protein
MEQSDEWSGDILAQFDNWVEQFYEENIAQLFELAISGFGKRQMEDLVTKLRRRVIQKTAEQFSQKEINQFLAAVAKERRYDEVRQFCRQIAECQRLWSILTEFGEQHGANSTVGKGQQRVVCA